MSCIQSQCESCSVIADRMESVNLTGNTCLTSAGQSGSFYVLVCAQGVAGTPGGGMSDLA